jgi:hypothetical protein
MYLLTLLVSIALIGPAPAGSLFGKPGKPKAAERVPQLLSALKSDDERKRESAARELREVDAAAFPDVVRALIEVLQKDAKVGVRMEAADSLAKIRPVSQPAGMALEQAMSKDASLRVRLHARRLLLQYRLSGYSTKEKAEEAKVKPEAADPLPVAQKKARSAGSQHPRIPPETPPPPLLEPEPTPFPLRPMPPAVKTTDDPGK